MQGGAGGGGDSFGGGAAENGVANTGGGGGATSAYGGSGGSGRVILVAPDSVSATFSAGVSYTQQVSGSNIVYFVNAAGASDTVTFA